MLMVRDMEALRSVNASGIRSADKRISTTAASDGGEGQQWRIGGRLREERAQEPARERKVTRDLLEPLASPVLLFQEGHIQGKKSSHALAAVMAQEATHAVDLTAQDRSTQSLYKTFARVEGELEVVARVHELIPEPLAPRLGGRARRKPVRHRTHHVEPVKVNQDPRPRRVGTDLLASPRAQEVSSPSRTRCGARPVG